MVGVLVYFNYWHGLEKRFSAEGTTRLERFTGYYLLYLLPFAAAFFLQIIFYQNCTYYKTGWFWIILLLAPAFFAFRVIFNFHRPWVANIFSGADAPLYHYCINWIVRVFVLLVPVIAIWLIKDKTNQPLYGTSPLYGLKPYILMLLIMVPLVALASTQHDFLKVYPKVQVLDSIEMTSWKGKWRYIFFELCYGFDFISIEMFFRGFLILALARICGEHCIIPVACFYCMIHFGKPMGEAISSFFGGTLLGIVAFNTGSIWGGLLVHLGVAWMMEIGGFFGHLFGRAK